MVRRVVRSWRPVLGSVAASGLFLRAAAYTPWNNLGELLGTLADSAAFTTVLTAFAGNSTLLGLASLASRWLLYLIGIYLLVPELLPTSFGAWTDRPVPRALTTGGAFAMYLHYTGALPGPDVLWFPGSTALVAIGFLAYFGGGSDPFRPTGELAGIVQTAGLAEESGDSDEADLLDPAETPSVHPDAADRRSVMLRVVLAPVLCAMLAMMIAFFGLLVFVVGLFFPLPELSVLAWSAYGAVRERIQWLPGSDRSRDVDVEASIYDIVGPAFRNPIEGLVTVAGVAVGLLLSALPLLSFVRVLDALSLSEVRALVAQPVRGAPTFVLVGGMFLFGAYGLWYWSRVSRRIPQFMLSRDGRDSPTPPVTRPLYLTAPPSLVLVAFGALTLAAASHIHRHSGVEYWPPSYALAAGAVVVCGILFAIGVIWRTHRYARANGPQGADDENRTLPAAVATQVLAVALAGPVFYSYDAIVAGGPAVYFEQVAQTVGASGLFVGSGLLLFYHTTIWTRSESLSRFWAVFVRFGFVVAAGGLMAGATGLYTGSWTLPAVITGGCCLLGFVVVASEFWERRE
ncbi:MAG: hypothetical protein ABEI27_04705 [Halobellus sp.]|uniref:hypothetical protein n=1 Tax=Halobellus sp. TaxID=1979212 RepID=UPI0035D447EB